MLYFNVTKKNKLFYLHSSCETLLSKSCKENLRGIEKKKKKNQEILKASKINRNG